MMVSANTIHFLAILPECGMQSCFEKSRRLVPNQQERWKRPYIELCARFLNAIAAPLGSPTGNYRACNSSPRLSGQSSSPLACRPCREGTHRTMTTHRTPKFQPRHTYKTLDFSGSCSAKASKPMKYMSDDARALSSGYSRASWGQSFRCTVGNRTAPCLIQGAARLFLSQPRTSRMKYNGSVLAWLSTCATIAGNGAFVNINKQAGKVLAGLTRRRKAEAELYRLYR